MLTSIQQFLLFCGALMGFIGVGAGAFGAHFLKQRLGADLLSIFEVAVRYQMYHALAVILTVWLITMTSGNWASLAGCFFIGGTLIFSGSLYILVFTGGKAWGAITPIGGVLLLLGWIFLSLAALTSRV